MTTATLELGQGIEQNINFVTEGDFPFAYLDQYLTLLDPSAEIIGDTSRIPLDQDGAEICVELALNFRTVNTLHPRPDDSTEVKRELSNAKSALIIANLAKKAMLASMIEDTNRRDRDDQVIDWVTRASKELTRFKERIFITKSINGISREILACNYLEILYGRERLRKSNLAQDRMQATDVFVRHPSGLVLRIDAKSVNSLANVPEDSKLIVASPLEGTDNYIPTWAIGKKAMKLVGGLEPFQVPVLYFCPDTHSRPPTREIRLPNQTIHFSSFDSPIDIRTLHDLEEGCDAIVACFSPEFLAIS